ncbi:MAG: hypothetical protein KDD46_05240, partial [Bdellovibrionales bacterium]|nr:hypothetical protein [Bdellovibrionales bacterium]
MSLNLKSNFLSTLFAILFLWNCGEKNQIDFGAPIFSNNNFSNAQILLHYPEHYLANINGIILRVQNLENAKTVQLFSSATCSENSFVDEKAPTQNKVDFHVALTEDGTYNYYTKIVSNNGQTSSCIGPASYAFDSTPPKFIGSSSFGDSISLTTSESVNDIFIYDEFTCSNQVGQLIASAEGNDYVYAPTLPASGIYAFYAQTTDIAMNLSDCFGPLIYIYTNALPYLTIDPPTPLDINTGNVTYDVHYYNASTVNLTTGDITVNATGTVTYTVNVLNGTSTDPTIEVNITGGNGTIDSIDVGDGTAFDLIDIAFGESENTTVNIDNIPPSTSISGPSVTSIGAGNVDYDVTYVGANAINLTTGFVTVNTSGSVAYTVSVLNGTTATPTIRVSVTGGDGTIDSVILAGGAASDDAGNTDPGDSNATTVNVQNNLPAVDFTIASQASVAESGTMTITASIASPYFFDVTVPFSVHGSSTALDPDDFSISASPVIITAGNTTADITITIAPDNLDESNETVIVNMGVPTNGNLGTTTTHTATITDDDTAPGVTLSVDNANIDEDGDPFATFTATLDAVSGLDVTVNLSSSGTATGGGTDYTLSTTSIVILAGNTTGTATVTADQDTLDENNETVIIDIDSVTNGTETGTQQQTTTITDDDDAPAVTLTVDNANIDEDGDPFATFTATLSAASSFDVTVNLAYSGTATGVGVDYTASSSSIVILAGSTTGTVTVTADEDVFEESDETVIVDIDSVVNGTETGTQQQTTTIVDNEPPVVIIGAPSTTLENTGPIDYAVTYTAATIINLTPGDVTVTTTGTVAVNVTILNGTTANPTLRLDTITGDGTITEVAIAAGTSSDGGGFMDSGDNETTVVTIDNTAPTPVVSISATTPTPGDYNPPIIDVNVGADPGGLTSISLYRDDPTCLSTAVD